MSYFKLKKLKGGHPIILDENKRKQYIESLNEHFEGWHKIGGLSPYRISVARDRQRKRETKISPDIISFLKENGDYDQAIFNWSSWRRYVAKARKELKSEKPRKQQQRSRQTTQSKRKKSSTTVVRNLSPMLDPDLSPPIYSVPIPNQQSLSKIVQKNTRDNDDVEEDEPIKPLTARQKHLRETKYKNLNDKDFQLLYWDPINEEWTL